MLEERQRCYADEPSVYLEIASRHVAPPYTNHHPTAVGRVFCLEPIQGGEDTAVNVSYAESIEPRDVFNRRTGDEMRIRVGREEVVAGKRHLQARVISTRDGSGRQDVGTELHIVLFER